MAKKNLDTLIEALKIFRIYGNPSSPTYCSHDLLTICGIEPDVVSDEHKKQLEKYGFDVNEDEDCFYSYYYGSA